MTATVSTAAELTEALAAGEMSIEVHGEISGMPMITLGPGVSVTGGSLKFSAKGVRLTSNNTLTDIVITTADHELAILNDTTVSDLGTITLHRVTASGQVQILIRDAIRSGQVTSRSTGSPWWPPMSAAGWNDHTASASTPCKAPSPSGTSRPTQP